VTANGGEIIGSLAVPPGTTDYGPFLTQVLAKKPDYVACIVNGMMFINCMKQAYAMGMKDKMKFMSFHGNIEEVNGCGPEVIQDVVLVTDYFWNLPNEKNKAFVEKYLKKYGSNKRPSMRHFLHYASVLLWADWCQEGGHSGTEGRLFRAPRLQGGLRQGRDRNSEDRRPHHGPADRCSPRQGSQRDEG